MIRKMQEVLVDTDLSDFDLDNIKALDFIVDLNSSDKYINKLKPN